MSEDFEKPLSIDEPFRGWDKPDWHSWYMAMAMVAATRSIDTSTKHGCFIVDKNNRPLSMGYNGPPPNCDDDNVPMTRPEKYDWMLHAEANAMDNATAPLEGATVYVTGHPCEKCFGRMLAKRISKCVYGPIGSKVVTEDTKLVIAKMNVIDMDRLSKALFPRQAPKITMVEFRGDFQSVLSLAKDYAEIKCGL